VRRLGFKIRLVGVYVALAGIVLALTVVGTHHLLSRAVLGQLIDDALVALAEAEAAELAAEPDEPIRVHELGPGVARLSVERLNKFVQVVGLDGQVIARSVTLGRTQLPVSPVTLSRLRQKEVVLETDEHFGRYPVRIVSMPVEIGGRLYAVQVAMFMHDAHFILRAAQRLYLGSALTILVGLGLAGAWLARRALDPIDRIVRRARQIGESTLSERLPHPGSQDEMGRLVDALNAMLDRIQRGVEIQRRFAANASHELRSPLLRLRTEIEISLRRPREVPEYERALRSCLDEVEWLSRLTDQLLTLARLEVEGGPAALVDPSALGPVLRDAVRHLGPEALRRQVTIDLDAPPPALAVRIPPGVAGLVFANLLDNAVKFSPRGGRIRVEVATRDGEVVVAVSDGGPGIPPDELLRVFEPFYRGKVGAPATSGTGLGLAICRTLLDRYGGAIGVESPAGGGATFRVRLPLAS